MAKGSNFEREICKLLSRWWTSGERDDVFWRSSQSGGRATQRAKSGHKTFGSYGDIAAVDPIGQPLLRYFTIELKRGRSHGFLGDVLDVKGDNSRHPFVATLRQARRSALQAGSKTWLLICRRDRRQAMVYLPSHYADRLLPSEDYPAALCRIVIGSNLRKIVAVSLEYFLGRVRPKQIIEAI
jgi:hypothetical protein